MYSIKNISLYIPHVFPNLDREFLTEQFSQVGDVDHIDMVLKQDKDGKSYNAVYVHFKNWLNDIETKEFQADVLNPEQEARFYYDGPWYWIVLPNTAKKQVSGDRKPKIDLGGAKSISSGSFSTPKKAEVKDFIPVPPLIRKTNVATRATMPLTPRNLESEFNCTEFDSDGFRISALDWSDPVYTYTRDDFDNMEQIDNCLLHEEVCDYCLDYVECDAMYTADIDEIFDQMDEVEDIMESEQDIHFANYDIRYVNAIVKENSDLKNELGMYKAVLNKYRAGGYI